MRFLKSIKTTRTLIGVTIFLSSLVALFSWSLASPVGAAPDETYHLAKTWCANGIRTGICEIDAQGNKSVPSAVVPSCFQHDPYQDASCSALTNNLTWTDYNSKVKDGSEPTMWNRALSIFAGNPVWVHVLIMRLASVVLICALLFFAFLNFDQLHRQALVITSFSIMIPHGIYLLSSAHPSGLAIWAGFIAAGATSQYLNNYFKICDLNRNQLGIIVLISTLIIFSTRKEVLGYLLFFILLQNLILFVAAGRLSRPKAFGIFLFTAIGVYALSKIQQALNFTILPLSLYKTSSDFGAGRAPWNIFVTNLFNFPSIITGGFGSWGLGALDTPIPMIVWISVFCIFVGSFALLIPGNSNENLFGYLSLLLFSIIFILLNLQSARAYVGEEIQPRYILPLIAMGFFAYLANSNFSLLRQNKFSLKVSFLVLATTANGVALWATMRRFISGIGVGELDLMWHRRWWWSNEIFDHKIFKYFLNPDSIWIMGTLSFALTLYLLLFRELNKPKFVEYI